MTIQTFPTLDATAIGPTLNAVHAYAQVLGDWLGSSLPRRKHWWQLTVKPSVRGISTGLLPPGTTWHTEGFSGAVLPYRSLLGNANPADYLVELWNDLLTAGRKHI